MWGERAAGSRLICAALAVVLGSLSGPFADPMQLPVEEPIDVNEIHLDLRASKIEIVVDSTEEPWMRITDRQNAENTEGFALLDDMGNTLQIGQPHGDESIAPRLKVELTVRPGDRLVIRGTDLDVSIVDSTVSRPNDAEAVPPAPLPAQFGQRNHRVSLDLIGGGAQLDRVSDLFVKAQDATISVNGAVGLVEMDLDHANALIEDNLGPLVLKGLESEFDVRASHGNVRVDLVGGSAALESGTGAVRCRMEGATAFLQTWQGEMFFEGDSNQISILESGMARSRCDLKGTDQEVVIEAFAGAVDARLTGGSVDASDVAGTVTVHGTAGTSVGLTDVSDLVELKLEDASSAEVERLQRRLRANLKESRLDAANIRSADLRASDSTITVRESAGAARFELNNSEADLDLRSANGSPEIVMNGRSNARVQLRDPCIVRSSSEMEQMGDRVFVSGCEMASRNNNTRMRQINRGAAPSILVIEVGEDANLEVTGL